MLSVSLCAFFNTFFFGTETRIDGREVERSSRFRVARQKVAL